MKDRTEVAPDEIVIEPTPQNLQVALQGMRDLAFIKGQRYQQQQWRASRLYTRPEIVEFSRRVIKEAKRLNVPLFAHEFYRSPERQRELAAQGKSKLVDGAHNRGAAVDIVHGTKGWDLTRAQWSLIGHVGKEVATRQGISVVWGGDWNFYDPAHWELENWRDLAPF